MEDQQPRWVDVVLAATVVAVIAAAIAADLGGERRPDAYAYLFAVGLGALMLLRGRYPVLTLLATAAGILAYYTFGYPAIGLAVPAAAALYSAAERGRRRWAVCVAAGLLVVSSFFRIREGDSLALLFGYELASTATLMAAVIALGDGTRSRRLWRAEHRGRLQQAELEREQEAARRVEEERLRIARDLHDVLAHTVSVISLHADVAAEALDDDPAAVRTALHNVRSASSEATAELRRTLGLLRGSAEESPRNPAGGLSQLNRLVRATRESGLAVSSGSRASPPTCRSSSTPRRAASSRSPSRTRCAMRAPAAPRCSCATQTIGSTSASPTTAAGRPGSTRRPGTA